MTKTEINESTINPHIQFKSLNIIEPILRAVKEEGYITPTPIQAQSIPIILQGTDLLGCAQTGTGKTAAFAIPILQILSSNKVYQKKSEKPHRYPDKRTGNSNWRKF